MNGSTRPWDGPSLEIAEVHHIAMFRALYLGDFLCSVPALRALKQRFPDAELTFIGLPWLHGIVDRFRHIDRFVEFPGYGNLEGLLSDPATLGRFLTEAHGHGYDLAIQMHGDGRVSNEFVVQLGASATLGYRPSMDLVAPPQLDLELQWNDDEHEVLRWLRLVRALGATSDPQLEFPVLPGDEVESAEVAWAVGLDLRSPIMVVHPGAKDPDRRWPPASFALVADRLARELGAQVVVTGTCAELPIAQEVADLMQMDAHILAGKTSLGGLASLLSRARLLVTNDSGPSHMAAALRVPSVVLFGPTDPGRWAPTDTVLHRALAAGQGHPISSIAVERVLEESLRQVSRCAHLTS